MVLEIGITSEQMKEMITWDSYIILKFVTTNFSLKFNFRIESLMRKLQNKYLSAHGLPSVQLPIYIVVIINPYSSIIQNNKRAKVSLQSSWNISRKTSFILRFVWCRIESFCSKYKRLLFYLYSNNDGTPNNESKEKINRGEIITF